MTQKTILKLIGSLALVVAGLLAILIGFVVALIVEARWLLISLGGLVFIILGGAIIGTELNKFKRLLKRSFGPETRTRIKR